MEIEKIKDVLKNTLSEERFYHSLCVMDMCEKLAKFYNLNVETAKLVGLAHDVAKEMPSDEKLNYAKDNNILVDKVEFSTPSLLHAKIGADICKKQFGFSDSMCKAISLHTTGGENMDMLSKILFVGDGIGVDRNWEDIDYVRDLVFKDIDASVFYMLNTIIKKCTNNNKPIHMNTIIARNWLLLNQKN